MLRGPVSPILDDHPESSPSSSKPSSSVLGELTQAKHDLGHNGGSEGNVTEPPEKGLLDTLLNKLYQLSGGRLGRVPASLVKSREERSKARAPKVKELAAAIVEGFRTMPQTSRGSRIQMNLELDGKVKKGMKELSETQKLAGEFFEEDYEALKQEIVDSVHEQLGHEPEKVRGFASRLGLVPPKHDLEKMLFETSQGNLFDLKFACKKREIPLTKHDRSTSPFENPTRTRQDNKAAFATSGAMFAQEATKLRSGESTFRKLDGAVADRTRRFFGCASAYVQDCKERARKGEHVDVSVLNELKGLLDKSFNPKFGGVGRFPDPVGDKNADKRFMGWAFTKFNPQSDLSGNGDALQVLEDELQYFEAHMDEYLERAEQSPIVMDTLATQVHGTLGQIFNDILFNTKLTDGPAKKETTRLFAIFQDKTKGVLSPDLKLDKLTDLQGRIRTNPLMMEISIENITGQVAENALADLQEELGGDYDLSREILTRALMRSENTTLDTVSGRRGRFKDVTESYRDEFTGRSDALNLVMNLPDGDYDTEAQRLASGLCLHREDGERLGQAITKDKVFAHGTRPLTTQRDRTLPPQLESIAGNPATAPEQIRDCLSREVGQLKDEMESLHDKRKNLTELIDTLKDGKQPPRRFDEKGILSRLFGRWDIDWSDPKDQEFVKSRLGPLQEDLEVLDQEISELEHRLEKTEGLQQRFLLASMPPGVRELYVERTTKEIDVKLQNELRDNAKKAPALAENLSGRDFGSIPVEDQQGRVHQLRDLSKENTVSAMIHEAHQRTLCSISGTTTDICLSLYAQYGPESMGEWTQALLDVADRKRQPEDLPEGFRDMFSSLSLFMQGGQYHTPAEVLGGMLIVGATMEKPGEATDKSLMETRYRSLLKQLEGQPESFFINDPAGREHFRLAIGKTSDTLLDTAPPKEAPKVKAQEAPLGGLRPRDKLAFEDDIGRDRPGLHRANLGSREHLSSTVEVSRLKQVKREQLQALKQRDWTGELLVSPHPGRDKLTQRALERAKTERERQAIHSDKARTDLSILKDEIDVLKGMANAPGAALMGLHPEYATAVPEHLEHLFKISEALDDVGTALSLVKYSVGIVKAGDKAKALGAQLEETERALGSLKVLGKEVHSAAVNKGERRKQLEVIRQKMEAAEKVGAPTLPPEKIKELTNRRVALSQQIGEFEKTIVQGEKASNPHAVERGKKGIERCQAEIGQIDRQMDNPLLFEAESLESQVREIDRKIIEVRDRQAPPLRLDSAGSFETGRQQQISHLEGQRNVLTGRLDAIRGISDTIVELRSIYDEALTSYASQEESLAKLQGAYDKLAPKAEKLLEEVKDLRYKLSENSWKRYLRYPAGVGSSLASLAALLAPAGSLALQGLKFAGKILGLFGLISAIASTGRVIRSGIAIHRLSGQIKEHEEALEKLKSETREKLKSETGQEPSESEVLKVMANDMDSASLKALLESSIDELKQAKTDEWRDLVGEALSALSGYASFIVSILTIAGVASGVGLPLALVGLGLGLMGSGVLIGGAIAKRRRGEHRANKTADLQSGLNELNGSKSLSEVASSNPQIAKLAKAHPNDIQGVKTACRAYLQKRYINVHAQATYHNLAGELEVLKVFAQEKKLAPGISREGFIPPPSSSQHGAQEQYLKEVRDAYNKENGAGAFARDFPTLSQLAAKPSIGAHGVAEIVWSGSAKEGMATLLQKMGVKAVKTEDFTADSFDSAPKSEQGSVERGLESATSGIHCNFYESGMAGVAIGLKKHSGLLVDALQAESQTLQAKVFADELSDFSGRPSTTGSQARTFFGGMHEFSGLAQGSEGGRQPDRVMREILGQAGLGHRMAEVNPKSDRGWGEWAESGLGTVFDKEGRGEVALRTMAQDQLQRSEEPESPLPFFVGIERFDPTSGKRLDLSVDPMGTIESAEGTTKFSPDLITCNRGDTRGRARHVTYDRVGSQWFLNEGGRRVTVDLSPEALERGRKSPNLALRALSHRIYRDLHENAVLVGYSMTQRPFSSRENRGLSDLVNLMTDQADLAGIGRSRHEEADQLAKLAPPFSELRTRFSNHEQLDGLERIWHESKTIVRENKSGRPTEAARGRLVQIHDFLQSLTPGGVSGSPQETVGEPLVSDPTTRPVLSSSVTPSSVRSGPVRTSPTESPYATNKKTIDGLIKQLSSSSLPNAQEAAGRLQALTRHGYSSVDGASLPKEPGELIAHLLSPSFQEDSLLKLSRAWSSDIASPGVGLSNGANNCFMNSALAAFRGMGVASTVPGLTHLPSYRDGGIRTDSQSRALREELALKLPGLPGEVRGSIRSGSSPDQHDANQVLLALLDHSAMPRLSLVATSEAKPPLDLKSQKAEQHPMLPLKISGQPGQTTMQAMVADFTKPEEMTGLKISGESGEVTTDGTRSIGFGSAPDKLAVQIGRFQSDAYGGTSRLPVEVTDLLAGIDLPVGDQSVKYNLKGVVCHQPGGSSTNAFRGHYVYYEHEAGNDWREINDGKVTPFDITADQTRHDDILKNCYLATYQKNT